MVTQKEIFNQIKNGVSASKDAILIEDTFNVLVRSKNYSYQFGKTEAWWSDKNYRTIAKDIQDSIKHFKSR